MLEKSKTITLITDLWGAEKADYIDLFKKHLPSGTELLMLDAIAIGGVDRMVYEENALHHQFVSFGIANAAKKLCDLEVKSDIFVGCSVGGTIVWEASKMGLEVGRLFALSSTRLRTCKEKPPFAFELYYGCADPYRPDEIWFDKMGRERIHLLNGGHDIYRQEDHIKKICYDVKKYVSQTLVS